MNFINRNYDKTNKKEANKAILEGIKAVPSKDTKNTKDDKKQK